MDPIILDGRHGEGGGQILRTGLALAIATGRPFELHHIRGGRKRPGLMRQHLACVRAAAEITGTSIDGAELGSQRIAFQPGPVGAGSYRFAVGSAGSCVLVLQTVLMPLLLAESSSELLLEGGTHNGMAPPFDALADSFLPLLARMGGRVQVELEQAGFYPAGGGRIRVLIEPAGPPEPLTLLKRGPSTFRKALIDHANLGDEIPHRQGQLLSRALPLLGKHIELREHAASPGPGNAISVLLGFENLTEVFTVFGARNMPSKRLISGLSRQVKHFLAHDAPVGEHLADQLLLPMALLAGGRFRSAKPTLHTITNAEVINTFLGEGTVTIDGQDVAVVCNA